MNKQEEERRAKLMKMRETRLPDIRKQFEENQNRHFNSNFKRGGKDAHMAKNTKKSANKKKATGDNKDSRKVNLSVSTRKGEMVHFIGPIFFTKIIIFLV